MFQFGRLKWALRKVLLPLRMNDLVLDVGSGGNPNPRSDVLMDRLIGAEHRGGAPILIDRPTVFGDATKLPFKDKAFDFVIASHILEHMSDPSSFLNELQRVGKAGYIETPNFIFERLNPFDIHCLEIAAINGVLHIHKKRKHIEDSFIGNLSFLELNSEWKNLLCRRPELFHVRFFWKDKIKYQIHNPNISTNWIEDILDKSNTDQATHGYLSTSIEFRRVGLALLANWFRQLRKYRLKNFDLNSILVCPECKGKLDRNRKSLRCEVCSLAWTANPHPNFSERIG